MGQLFQVSGYKDDMPGTRCMDQTQDQDVLFKNNGRRSRPDTIIWLNLVLITSMHGNMPTSEKATGESPTAIYLL